MELHLFELVQIALIKIYHFCVRISLWKETFRLYVNGWTIWDQKHHIVSFVWDTESQPSGAQICSSKRSSIGAFSPPRPLLPGEFTAPLLLSCLRLEPGLHSLFLFPLYLVAASSPFKKLCCINMKLGCIIESPLQNLPTSQYSPFFNTPNLRTMFVLWLSIFSSCFKQGTLFKIIISSNWSQTCFWCALLEVPLFVFCRDWIFDLFLGHLSLFNYLKSLHFKDLPQFFICFFQPFYLFSLLFYPLVQFWNCCLKSFCLFFQSFSFSQSGQYMFHIEAPLLYATL